MDDALAVSVRFFAQYRERAGEARREVELPAGSTVGDLLATLASGGLSLPDGGRVAVNREYASEERSLEDGDEVALIPPVAGG